MTQNLMDGLLSEMNRVREIIKKYESTLIKGVGIFASTLMKADIKEAEQSISNGDVIQMLQSYSTLKEYEL